MNSLVSHIGIFTSGGDSPGMNAAIRAVVRTALFHGKKITGIRYGYEGMIDGDFAEMNHSSVSNIIQRGGTILKTARSERFHEKEFRKTAFDNLRKKGIDSLIALGGDGTFRGALAFSEEFDIPVMGVPCTIDNDLFGTDFTIGYDTAINTAMEAIDKIRDTADSHNRLFFVEVMGRDAGFIALRSGIGSGAEAILVPEHAGDFDLLIRKFEKGWQREKSSRIVIVAEGEEEGGAFEIARKVKEKFSEVDARVVILGHIQRGGNPTCMDRVLASRLGMAAVEALLEGKRNLATGTLHRDISFTPFDRATKHHEEINRAMLHLVEVLSC